MGQAKSKTRYHTSGHPETLQFVPQKDNSTTPYNLKKSEEREEKKSSNKPSDHCSKEIDCQNSSFNELDKGDKNNNRQSPNDSPSLLSNSMPKAKTGRSHANTKTKRLSLLPETKRKMDSKKRLEKSPDRTSVSKDRASIGGSLKLQQELKTRPKRRTPTENTKSKHNSVDSSFTKKRSSKKSGVDANGELPKEKSKRPRRDSLDAYFEFARQLSFNALIKSDEGKSKSSKKTAKRLRRLSADAEGTKRKTFKKLSLESKDKRSISNTSVSSSGSRRVGLQKRSSSSNSSSYVNSSRSHTDDTVDIEIYSGSTPKHRSLKLSRGIDRYSEVSNFKFNGNLTDRPKSNTSHEAKNQRHKSDINASRSKKSKNSKHIADELVEISKGVTAEDFELISVIGRGSFAKVMQVRYKKDGKIYAMKVMKKNNIIARNQVQHMRDEKTILQKISHPFIVKLNYAFQSEDSLFLVLDFVNGGEVFHHLKVEKRFKEERTRFYASEIALAIMHLHKNGIVYRDLKPENILLDKDGHIIITDFGLSKEVDENSKNQFKTMAGTPEYLAPEILTGGGHSYEVDWWSFGNLLYEMLTGLTPFFSKNIRVMYHKILNAEIEFPSYVSEKARDLILRLLERDPSVRLKSEGVRSHLFFEDVDWDSVEAKKITPKWKPNVSSEHDLNQIDPIFLQEHINGDSLGSYPPLNNILDESDKNIFEGFSYVGSADLNTTQIPM